MATSLSTYGHPSNTWFLRPIWAHNPNGILIGSAVFAQTTVECPYTLQWDAHYPPKICPFPWGMWTPSNTWFPGPPKSWTQTAARSVQPLLEGSLVWQTDQPTDRPTDHATRSVRIGRIYVRSTAMRPNNNTTITSLAFIWIDWKCETWNNGTIKNAGVETAITGNNGQRHSVEGGEKCGTCLYGQPKEHLVCL